jgi:hypothetical protein
MKLPDHQSDPKDIYRTGHPILAKIKWINNLGETRFFYEVVYYDGGWFTDPQSETFLNDETVVDWKYCKDCF